MKVKAYLNHLNRKSYVSLEPINRRGELLDCSLGCNLFGVSQRVLDAAKEYDWSRVWCYPDPAYLDLKEKLSKFWTGYADLDKRQIQIANGAMVVLERVNKIFIEPGAKVLGYSPQFTEYATDVEACGGRYEAVILDQAERFGFHTERLLAKISEDYSLVYIDNPNNPTGQVISLGQIEEIIKQAGKKGVVVIIDEAYGDYIGKENSAVNLIDKYTNLIVVRSFSKGLGLAGLRIGYGIFPYELASYYEKINIPFSVSQVSCFLAAEALLDEDFILNCRKMVEREKAKLIAGLEERGYFVGESFESCPIFVLGHSDGEVSLKARLLGRGILTEGGEGFRNLGDKYVRVNTPPSAEGFLACL